MMIKKTFHSIEEFSLLNISIFRSKEMIIIMIIIEKLYLF